MDVTFWDNFWTMVHGWPPIGQGFFLLIVASGFFGMIRYAWHMSAVCIHGWPPEHCKETDDDDED